MGEVAITNYTIVLGRGVAAIKGNKFIFQILYKMKKCRFWDKLSTGSTFKSINSNDIKMAPLILPNKKEQQKIGDFFKKINDHISSGKANIKEFKQIKKFLLQNMFI